MKAENWQWSSVWRREKGTPKQKKLLSPWPVPEPKDYLKWLNEPQTKEEYEALERATEKGSPYGGDNWVDVIVKKFNLETTVRSRGRPKKGG